MEKYVSSLWLECLCFSIPHIWNLVYQVKSFPDHKLFLSQTWNLRNSEWFLRRDGLALGGSPCLATECTDCVLESKPGCSTNNSWCSIKPYSNLNPIKQPQMAGSQLIYIKYSRSVSLPGSHDLPEHWLDLESEFLHHRCSGKLELKL